MRASVAWWRPATPSCSANPAPASGPHQPQGGMHRVLTLQEISDRLEIQELLANYSHAIDQRDWDALDDVFTPDALIDYSEMGGSVGDLPSTKEFLAGAMPRFASFQHMVATSKLHFDGDTATGRTICH